MTKPDRHSLGTPNEKRRKGSEAGLEVIKETSPHDDRWGEEQAAEGGNEERDADRFTLRRTRRVDGSEQLLKCTVVLWPRNALSNQDSGMRLAQEQKLGRLALSAASSPNFPRLNRKI